MEPTALSGKGFFMKKKIGLLGLGTAMLLAAAALGINGLPAAGAVRGRETQLNGTQMELTEDEAREYPEEEFYETETDMTEFEGKLEDITA